MKLLHPSRVVKNILSLSGLEMVNKLIPVLVLPYVVRVIGVENYGIVNWAQALVLYFTLTVNYGFDFSATREISSNRFNNKRLSVIFNKVVFSKILLFVFCTIVYSVLLLLIPKIRDHYVLFILTYLVNIGHIFFPTWMLQGTENLTTFAVYNLIIKIIANLFLLFFLREESQFYLIPAFLSLGHIIIGIIAFAYCIKYYNLIIRLPRINTLFSVINKDKYIFFSTISNDLIVTGNILVLGFLSTDRSVGLFSAVSKIIIVLINLFFTPITQAFFPKLAYDIKENFKKGWLQVQKLALVMGTFSLMLSVFIFIAAYPLIKVLFGQEFISVTNDLRFVSVIVLINAFRQVWTVQGLLNLKMDKIYFIILTLCAVFGMGLNVILIQNGFAHFGTCIAWLVTEVFITGSAFFILKIRDLSPLDFSLIKPVFSELLRKFYASLGR